MTPYYLEQMENIRRAAERGLKLEQDKNWTGALVRGNIDTFQHIIDIVNEMKAANS